MNEQKTKHTSKKLIIFLILFILLLIILFMNNISASKPSSESHDENTTITESESSISAQEFVSDITVGWNLGNTLDSCTDRSNRNNGTYPSSFYETAWGNPVATKELIDAVSAAGFNTIRIPVTWYYNTYDVDNHLLIGEDWLNRVAEVVQYALDNNMYVILNSHHDAPIIWADVRDIEEVSSNAEDLWSQIAEYFKDYDYHLIFEGYNEINTKDDSWRYSKGAVNATNALNQLFVDTVRTSGGNNTERILICGTYLNETSEKILKNFVLPEDSVDNRLVIEVHNYDTIYNQEITDLFQRLDEFSQTQCAPVIIGEFGTNNSFSPIEYRDIHAGNYVARAAQYGLKCFWWDDGTTYNIFDRNNYAVTEKGILNALMNPVAFETKDHATYSFNTKEDYSYSIIQSSDGSLVESSQGAMTLNINNSGLVVTPRCGYRISLLAKHNADGLRLVSIAFYNAENNLISYTSVNEQTSYDITAPNNAAYMRISIYNPWGYRSEEEYTKYFEHNSLSIEITEYEIP